MSTRSPPLSRRARRSSGSACRGAVRRYVPGSSRRGPTRIHRRIRSTPRSIQSRPTRFRSRGGVVHPWHSIDAPRTHLARRVSRCSARPGRPRRPPDRERRGALPTLPRPRGALRRVFRRFRLTLRPTRGLDVPHRARFAAARLSDRHRATGPHAQMHRQLRGVRADSGAACRTYRFNVNGREAHLRFLSRSLDAVGRHLSLFESDQHDVQTKTAALSGGGISKLGCSSLLDDPSQQPTRTAVGGKARVHGVAAATGHANTLPPLRPAEMSLS